MSDRYRPPSSTSLALVVLLAPCILPLVAAQSSSSVNPSANVIEGRTWIVIVDVVILVSRRPCLSILIGKARPAHWILLITQISTIIGATAILGDMAWRELYKGRASTVRMRLVQGLVFSDLTLG